MRKFSTPCRYVCLLCRCLARRVISPTAAFMPRQPFPVSWVFRPALPSLPTFLSAMQTDDKSRRVIYGGFGCAQYRPDIYGNSNHHEATGSPGKVQVRERKRNTDLSGDFLLSEQAVEPPWTEQRRRCRPECGRCCILGVYAKKRLCVFQQKLPKRSVFSVLTQLNKLKLKDNTGVFAFLSLCQLPRLLVFFNQFLVPSARSQHRDVRVCCFPLFRGLWLPFILAQHEEQLPHTWIFPSKMIHHC